MRIPDSFKAAQQAAFQDKTIQHFAAVETAGALGGKTRTPAPTPSGSYQVNVRILSDALTAQEYGLRLGRDIQITSSDALPIPAGEYVKWDGRTYHIVGALPRDSHMLLLGELVS